jgi:hypothetical protein
MDRRGQSNQNEPFSTRDGRPLRLAIYPPIRLRGMAGCLHLDLDHDSLGCVHGKHISPLQAISGQSCGPAET